MKHMVKNRLFLILKLAVILFVVSPFYITVIHPVESKPGMVSNRLAFPKATHWDNSTRTIEASNFGLTMKSSLFTTVVTALVITLICTMPAYIIVRKNNRFCNAVCYIFADAMIIPFQSITTLLYIDVTRWRLLNTPYGSIMARIGFRVVFTALLVPGSVEGTPRELEEVATIDGAGIYSIFFHIVFLLMKSIILTSVVPNILNARNGFQIFLIPLQKKIVCNVPLTQYSFLGENNIELELVFILLILFMIPILILYPILQKCTIGGIISGTVRS